MSISYLDKYRPLYILLTVIFFLIAVFIPAPVIASENKTSSDLIAKLQQGGYIIYLRHGATDHAQNDMDLSDLRDCKNQRNLSEKGKAQSTALNQILKDFKIKIGSVYSSPYCRCVDTALYTFNRVEIDHDMRATFATNKKETKQLIEYLRKQLGTLPLANHNTVLVGHTANLRELTDVWPKPEGVMHIFKPTSEKSYIHIGRITPDEWVSIANGTQ